MKRQMVVTPYKNSILCCLYEDDRLAEAVLEDAHDSIRVGDIYIGKVMKIAANIDAAFVAIAPGINGYYPLKENRIHLHADRAPDDRLACGDEIMVQVKRENLKTKAYTLTSAISLAGDFIVLDTGHDQVRISSKITDERRRAALLQDACAAAGDIRFGITVRTAAAQADEQALRDEIRQLSETCETLFSVCRMRTCYFRLHAADPDYLKMMRRYMRMPEFDLVTDIRSVYESARDCYLKAGSEDDADRLIRFYDDPSWPLVKLKNIEAQLEKALSKKVWLRSGAYLVIEQTEAMTVVDVNTGKNQRGHETEAYFLAVNLEAAEEMCRQIRLRNLSGIIIADFINMKDAESGQKLMQALRARAAQDPVQLTVVDRTRLQLVEMTRRKIRKSLAQQLSM